VVLFDTADAYGPGAEKGAKAQGESERLIASLLDKLGLPKVLLANQGRPRAHRRRGLGHQKFRRPPRAGRRFQSATTPRGRRRPGPRWSLGDGQMPSACWVHMRSSPWHGEQEGHPSWVREHSGTPVGPIPGALRGARWPHAQGAHDLRHEVRRRDLAGNRSHGHRPRHVEPERPGLPPADDVRHLRGAVARRAQPRGPDALPLPTTSRASLLPQLKDVPLRHITPDLVREWHATTALDTPRHCVGTPTGRCAPSSARPSETSSSGRTPATSAAGATPSG
jgi:hypothetical protein